MTSFRDGIERDGQRMAPAHLVGECLRSLLACAFVLLLSWPARGADFASHPALESANRKLVKIIGAGGLRGLQPHSTGFLVSAEGHIVTIWDHVLDERVVTVVLHNGRKLEGKVVGADPELDVAVIKIEGEDFPFFDLAESAEAGPGTRVYALSNMFRVAGGDEPMTVLHGVISARTRLEARKGVFEIPYKGPAYIVDAITNNSAGGGGVLITRDGRLLAMIGREVRNARTGTWINYAVPIGELQEAINEIRTGKFNRNKDRESELADGPSILNRYRPEDFGLVLVPDVVPRTPAFIDRVVADSPAGKAGLLPNDLVLFVNDDLISSCRVLKEQLGKLESGEALRLVVRRGTELVTVDWTVPEKAATTDR
jgi:serine protease Do